MPYSNEWPNAGPRIAMSVAGCAIREFAYAGHFNRSFGAEVGGDWFDLFEGGFEVFYLTIILSSSWRRLLSSMSCLAYSGLSPRSYSPG